MRSLSLGNNLTATVVSARAGCVVSLSGTVDETFDGNRLRAESRGTVIYDLDGVKRITSYGVREWIRLVGSLDVAYLGYVRCRPALVAQFNMVGKFPGRGQLISLYAPYLCECGHDFEVLFDLRKQHEALARFDPPTAACPRCGEQATVDDMPESYFAYVAATMPPRVPPVAEALIDARNLPPAPFKVDKEVAGNLTALWLSGALDEKTRYHRLVDGLEGDVVVIAEGLQASSADALKLFFERAGGSGVKLYLARAGLDVLAALATKRHAVNVVSARLSFTCPSCSDAFQADVDEAQRLPLLGTPPAGPPCRSCEAITRPDHAPESLAQGLASPFVAPPRIVRVYLEERPEGIESGVMGATAPQPVTPPSGGIVYGKYRLIRSIGSGGMAEIFLARQIGPEGFDRMVALKRIHPHLSQNDVFVDMFVQEARVAARLSHPNIVAIYDVAKIDGQFYIAMEYVRGWDLSTVLRLAASLGTPVPVGVAVRIVMDVCAGLQAAHSYVDEAGKPVPVVHRDVSPSNVLVAQTGISKLTDFGIAKASDTVISTESGVVKGKIAYMAPERLEGFGSPMDVRQDVFAVGVILHEALTGEFLFHREDRMATLRAALRDPIPHVSARRADVPRAIDAITLRALERNANDRYPSAQAFQADLETLLESHREIAARTADVEAWLAALIRRGREVGKVMSSSDTLPPVLMLTPLPRQRDTTPNSDAPTEAMPGITPPPAPVKGGGK